MLALVQIPSFFFPNDPPGDRIFITRGDNENTSQLCLKGKAKGWGEIAA
jgi:hypothetical protein